MTDKLLPCPFCGGEARLTEFDAHAPGSMKVMCWNCTVFVCKHPEPTEKTIEHWNTRAQTDVPAGYALVPIEPTVEMIYSIE